MDEEPSGCVEWTAVAACLNSATLEKGTAGGGSDEKDDEGERLALLPPLPLPLLLLLLLLLVLPLPLTLLPLPV